MHVRAERRISNIENGLAYVEKHIQELIGDNNYYGMYGVERIATASGRRYFGLSIGSRSARTTP